MIVDIRLGSTAYRVDLGRPIDIAIALDFHGPQPNAFGVPRALARAYEDQHFIGDTRRGGSCNFEELRFIPHCNGTHTEGVGHIARERISIHTILTETLIPSTLISVEPESSKQTRDTYNPAKNDDDVLITRKGISDALHAEDRSFLKGLIIRTLPNDDSKKSRNYMTNPPPFFSLEAMKFIAELGVEHLLVDIPSLERTFDEGKLSTHRLFWEVPPGTHDIDPERHSMKTVTEMIFVPNHVPDGRYVLTIQIPPFVTDAAPSRPLVFPVQS
jgi:arylformamidase